jgi:hypothetical protein
MDNVVSNLPERGYDPVVVIEIFFWRKQVRDEVVLPSILLDGAVALEGKPSSQRKPNHRPFHRRVVPEGKVPLDFLFKLGGHDPFFL